MSHYQVYVAVVIVAILTAAIGLVYCGLFITENLVAKIILLVCGGLASHLAWAIWKLHDKDLDELERRKRSGEPKWWKD